MRPRIRRVLEILMRSDDWIPVSALAEETGAGVRTLFRDLLELEYFLRPYGATIDKKRSLGVRLSGDVSKLAFRGKNEQTRISWMTAEQRQLSILVFLAFNPRTVKLAEIATLFSVSDSCVSSDLKDLDAVLERSSPGVLIVRQKGIGVSLEGPEWRLRAAALDCIVQLLRPEQLLQVVRASGESGPIGRMAAVLGMVRDRERIVDAIARAEKRLMLHFSWADLSLLFVYLGLALKRKTVRHEGFEPVFLSPAALSVPEDVARDLWNSLAASDPDETVWLRAVLSSLEAGESGESVSVHPAVPRIVRQLSASLSAGGFTGCEFDPRLPSLLEAALSPIVCKKLFSIPSAGQFSFERLSFPPVSESSYDGVVRDTVIPLARELAGVELSMRDLEPVRMALLTADGTLAPRKPNPRIVVTCLEGLCMAHLVTSVIRGSFPEVVVVASLSSDRLGEEWLAAERIDLIVSTFPTGLSSADEYLVSLPFDAAAFRTDFAKKISLFRARPDATAAGRSGSGEWNISPGSSDASAAPASAVFPEDAESAVDAPISLLQSFRLKLVDAPFLEEGLTALIAGEVAKGKKEMLRLKRDLDERESYGQVVLEQSGIRLFHCRSAAVGKPVGGVVRIAPGAPGGAPAAAMPGATYVYLIAPDPAKPGEIAALSKISVALIEDEAFTLALRTQGEIGIRKRLFAVFASSF